MESGTIDKFRESLQLHRDNLVGWLRSKRPNLKRLLGDETVPLSREKMESQLVVGKIEQALQQIEGGEFGKCALCDGEVEVERLALDFTTCVCLEHYSEAQIRDLENDLELAAKVQRHLLPAEVPKVSGIQLAVRSEPARIVGGDYFDFFPFRRKLQGLTIADVMGKGLPASMLMSNLQASLRILGPDNSELDQTATRLNELFRYNLKTIRFITLILAAIDTENSILHYCNAGHNPPLLLKKDTTEFVFLQPTGPAIGLLSEPIFYTKQIKFGPGDILLLYTDGLTEARNGQEEFGEKRLQTHVLQHREKTTEQILAGLFREIRAFSTGESDDLTAILIKIDDTR